MSSRKIFRLIGDILKNSETKLMLHHGIRAYSASAYTGRYCFETLSVTSPCKHVLHVELHRPEIHNAMNKEMLRELHECFERIQDDQQCRAVVLSGSGKMFSAGIDYADLKDLMAKLSNNEHDEDTPKDVARKAKFIRSILISFQDSFSSLEKCVKPVICAVDGGCIGAGMSLISAADIRYCSKDAFFQIKEVNMGMAAAMGSLQRVPKIVGNDSLLRELVFSARKMAAKEAKEMGLVNKIFADAETTKQSAIELAQQIASKSPVAVQGSKVCLKYSRDHEVWDGLRFMVNWNMVFLQSEDVVKATTAVADRSDSQPIFADL